MSPEVAARVRAAVAKHGEARVLDVLGLDPATAARLAAGFVVQQGSIAIADQRLALLDAPPVAPGAPRGRKEDRPPPPPTPAPASRTRPARSKRNGAA